MPEDAAQRASLAYRKARGAIWEGRVPEKYTRLVPYISGRRGLEIGAAEGVLSLMLARDNVMESVTALELREDRHREGLALQVHWRAAHPSVDRCVLLQGDILCRLNLLGHADTLIAIRTLYYLRESAHLMLEMARKSGVERVVLCGNKGRQAQHHADPHSELGRFNFLASTDGMTAALTRAGYWANPVHDEGDPIVIGTAH